MGVSNVMLETSYRGLALTLTSMLPLRLQIFLLPGSIIHSPGRSLRHLTASVKTS